MFKKMITLCICTGLLVATAAGCCCMTPATPSPAVPDPEPSTPPVEAALKVVPATMPVEVTTAPVETTEATEPTEATTEATTQKAEDTDPWKLAYIDFINTMGDEPTACQYQLIHVDNDGIPELFIHGSCEAAGSIVCSYKNGQVVYTHLRRLGGGSYIPKGGLVYNFNGNMGYYSFDIYRLTSSGFTLLLHGTQEEQVEEIVNEDGEIDYNYSYIFAVGDQDATEEEFNAAQAEVFNFNAAKPLYEYNSNIMLGYASILQRINAW